MTSSLNPNLKGRKVIADPVEPGIASNDSLKSDRHGVLTDGSLMRGESLAFSRIEHHDQITASVSEYARPGLLNRAVQPHELVFRPPLDLPVIFGIERLELVLKRLSRFLIGDQNDTERSLSGKTDIFGALMMQLGD